MERPNQEYDPPGDDDRICPRYFVDILENVEIPTENLYVGKMISDKTIRMTTVHNVLQHAWERYAGVKVHEITS